jgi:Uma2 family endonuclease
VGAQHIPKLMTVEEYEQIPDPPGGRYELHHGELVFVTHPVRQHGDLQRRLQDLLQPVARPLGFLVAVEYPYRPLPENEVWGADVACLVLERHRKFDKWLVGSPDLVIEVKSPSNTKAALDDNAMTTLAGDGAIEFWVVDGKKRTLTVYSKTHGIVIHRDGVVPVPLFDCSISLDALFAD